MKLVKLPDIASAPDARVTAQYRQFLGFYLALEEWVARALPADDYFFTWIVPDTVIIGRNQDLESEVNLPYCRHNNIQVVRRRSGGGCVFADHNNIMFSIVVPASDVTSTFAHCIRRMAGQLKKIGLNAEATGRNDIMVDGRKISGNAFYHLPGRAIVHGTMLYSTNPQHIANAITPSKAKLQSKRVQSVPAHIITGSELLPGWSLDRFHAALTDGIADGTVTLTHEQEAEVRAIADNYRRPEWLLGVSARAHNVHTASRRFDGVGEIAVAYTLDHEGRIDALQLTGDFFMLADIDPLITALRGINPSCAAEALSAVDIEKIIPGLHAGDLARLLNPQLIADTRQRPL